MALGELQIDISKLQVLIQIMHQNLGPRDQYYKTNFALKLRQDFDAFCEMLSEFSGGHI